MRLFTLLILFLIPVLGCKKDDPLVLISRANTLRTEKNFEESDKILQAVLQKDPKNTSALIAQGHNLEDQGKLEEALTRYQAVLQIEPSHISAILYSGNVYRRLGDLKTAIKYVSKAAGLSPGEGWIKNLLAHLYQQDGDLANARLNYEAAVRLVNNDDQFLLDLGAFCEKVSDFQCAIKHYSAFLGLYEQQDEIVIARHEKQITFAKDRLKALESKL
jgi:tetratricopeptide (TPR) repeat protein